KRSYDQSVGMMQSNITSEPFEVCGLDLLGPLTETNNGNKYIIVFIDLFTKWLECEPIPNKNAITIANWLKYKLFTRHSYVRKIITDNGREMTAGVVQEIMKLTNVEH